MGSDVPPLLWPLTVRLLEKEFKSLRIHLLINHNKFIAQTKEIDAMAERQRINYNRALLRHPEIKSRVNGIKNVIEQALRNCMPGKAVYFKKSWGASAVTPSWLANRAAVPIKILMPRKGQVLVGVVEVKGGIFKPVIHIKPSHLGIGENIAKALQFHGEFWRTPKVKKHGTIESPEELLGIRGM